MKTPIALAGLIFALLPMIVLSAPTKMAQKKTDASLYECVKCHMKVSAAVAKRDHYKDPMDGGTLVPVKTAHK